MDNDQTPINAQPKRRQPQAHEDLSLALRDRVLWPLGDRFLALSDGGRAAVAGGVVVLALAMGIGGYSLSSSDSGDPTPAAPMAATSAPAPEPAPVKAQPKPEPEPTLQGAAPVFKAPQGSDENRPATEPVADEPSAGASSASNTGNAATDMISSHPGATATARPSTATESVDGPPAGPAAIAVARKFADAFVVYETGAEKAEVRQAFKATAV